MSLLNCLTARTAKPVAIATLAALSFTAPTQAISADYSFRLATIDVETGNYFNYIAKPFAELVAELTGGAVEIQPLPAGTVGSVFKLHEALDDGLVDMVNWPTVFLGTADPVNAMIGGFPTGLGTDSLLAWTYYGGGQELLTQHRAETMNVHAMVLGSGPSEWFAHSHVPVQNAEDLANLKYRTLGNWAAIVGEAFGASPTTVPGSEVYSMLEKKGLDLAEYSLPAENLRQGYHETAEYIIYPGIHAPAWTFELMIDQDKWAELPDAHKRAMEVAARLVTYDSMFRTINEDIGAVLEINQRAADGKNTLLELSPEFQAEARVAARAWATRVAGEAAADGNAWPEKVLASITSFQDRWQEGSYYMVTDHASR
ncbi:hypothetical protein [Aestuariivita sp.]|jgi:TRAP-type mannitol/chloroaromatic compound transport system substrate-binding protein|uniref:hypothetical protein n=1 Tax=Aestuariivita sp. TaxID=1872407 RepID=UPI00216E4CA6|nr:hypothetical protein [Aestuariivita sp.]MCE8009403.1 hypothetical protein [Aestuariivita sp.]